MQLGENDADVLTKIRFADDLLLLGSSEQRIKCMPEDRMSKARDAGLNIHIGKTKCLTNDGINKTWSLRADGANVEILSGAGVVDYLGRRLCLGNLHDAGIDAQLTKARREFMSAKQELCGRHVGLKSR